MECSLNMTEENFVNVNTLLKKLKNLFSCRFCSAVKNEEAIVFYWTCNHIFCLDCIKGDKPCLVCSADKEHGKEGGKNRGRTHIDKPVRIIENENILRIFRSLINYQYPPPLNKSVIDTFVANTGYENNGLNQSLSTGNESSSLIFNNSSLTESSKTESKDETRKKKKTLNIFKRNYKGETPLHLACRKGNLALMQELINAGANPNVKDNAGWTPLHDSIVFGRKEVVKFLLRNGARVNIPGHQNMTALHQSVVEGYSKISKLLLKYGASKNARNVFGETPMDLIKKNNNLYLEQIMLNTEVKYTLPTWEDNHDVNDLKEIVLYTLNFNRNESSLYENFTSRFKIRTVEKLSLKSSATHIVVSLKEDVKITWDFICGILMACQVVSAKWIEDSIDSNELQKIESYKLSKGLYEGFHKSRQNKVNLLPGLFSGCHFYLGGNFEIYQTKYSSFPKTELKSLIEKNDGTILSRTPDPESLALEKTIPYHADINSSLANTSYYIIYSKEAWDPVPKYNMIHMKTLPVEWLLASVIKFELIDPQMDHTYMDCLEVLTD